MIPLRCEIVVKLVDIISLYNLGVEDYGEHRGGVELPEEEFEQHGGLSCVEVVIGFEVCHQLEKDVEAEGEEGYAA